MLRQHITNMDEIRPIILDLNAIAYEVFEKLKEV